MLQELSIRNFAIIDDLNISFSGGLTVLSGETGAGKSIIINAVNLLLGSRAVSKLIRTGSDTAELEALFFINPDTPVAKLMEEHGYDPSEGLLVRRIISSSDRHRIYINGRIATMQLLASITENLASISGQHAHQVLLKEDQHLLILDQFGGLVPLREKVRDLYNQIVPLTEKLKKYENLEKNQAEHIELIQFQKNEFEAISFSVDEDHQLEKEMIKLKNSENLYKIIHSSVQEIYSKQGAVIERLVDVKKDIEKASNIDFDLSSRVEELEDTVLRLEDITEELREYRSNIVIDEMRLEEVENRIDVLNKLKRKYGGSAATLEAVTEYYETICKELLNVQNISGSIKEIKDELVLLHGKISELSEKLSLKRNDVAVKLSRKVEKELSNLEMPGTSFKVDLTYEERSENSEYFLTVHEKIICENGIDKGLFMISPNPGEDLKPLVKIASGGELSRVVLALKAILAEIDSVETVVFDEVDAGIGGSVAEVVGQNIATLASFHQVICITHLPQIAKFADNHYKIVKKVSQGRTSTNIFPLNNEERLEEIARMLGGIEITAATIEHAREMLKETVS